MVDPSGRKQRGTEEPFHEGEEESKKASLMVNIQKTKIMVSSPITSLQIDREKVLNSDRLSFLAPQNHCRQ